MPEPFLPSTEGAALHWEVSGPVDAPALVLLHGYGASSLGWANWLPELSISHRVFRVDLPGFGSSPAPPRASNSPTQHARLIARWIREEVRQPAILLGHSLGGGVATVAALELMDVPRHRPRGLILMAGAVLPQPLPKYISLARIPLVGELGLALLPGRPLIRRILSEIVHDPSAVTPEVVERYARGLASIRRRWGLLEAARRLDPDDARPVAAQLGRLQIPALLLWGESDRVVRPEQGTALLDLLPRARLHLIPRCGHLPQEECPRTALDLILDFLGDLPSGNGDDPGAGSAA